MPDATPAAAQPDSPHRILIVDDNPAIHEDFRKVLAPTLPSHDTLDDLLAQVFGEETRPARVGQTFELDSAHQGREALAKVVQSLHERRPYALTFMDVRMPPGWDGIETVQHLWQQDPHLHVVICTAHSDYSWDQIVDKLGMSDRVVILKKPFDAIEVQQIAHAMTMKWSATRQAALKTAELEAMVRQRTDSLTSANERLRLSEERLARWFEACPLPIAIMAAEKFSCVEANEALVELLGVPKGEIQGAAWWSRHVRLPAVDHEGCHASLAAGLPVTRQPCEVLAADGAWREALLWLEPFALASGPHWLGMLQDVSEQVRLEAKLRQAQKLEAVGTLAAGIAHDFNNLLTVVQGHASLHLAAGGLEPSLHESLGEIDHAAGRAAELTRQLLTFSRKQIIDMRPTCLATLMARVSALLGRLIPENIALECHVAEDVPAIMADACSMEQVIVNLVVNARDAMPMGGRIAVQVARHRVGRPQPGNTAARLGDYACLTVRDDGSGMDEATLAHIFEPFFTTKEVGKGTGLGLATVDGIVKQHGGWIDVSSAPGAGSVFSLYVPALSGPLPTPAAEVMGVTSGHVQGTVLVVEDDAAVRALSRQVVASLGCRVLEAADGREALELSARHEGRIDLLVTDMVMPGGLTGVDVAHELLGTRPDLAVIYCSGYSQDLFEGTVNVREGANYLPKPFQVEQLRRIVRRALAPGPALSV